MLDILGVDQPRLQAVSLEQVERWPPVIASRLHYHPLDPQPDEPIRQLTQRADHRRMRGHLLHPALAARGGWEPDTTHDLGFPDIQRRNPLNDLLIVFGLDQHHLLPSLDRSHHVRPPGGTARANKRI